MTKRHLSVALAELSAVRLTCTDCGTAIELQFEKIVGNLPAAKCPGCGNLIYRGYRSGSDPLLTLADAIKALACLDSNFKIEFPVSEQE